MNDNNIKLFEICGCEPMGYDDEDTPFDSVKDRFTLDYVDSVFKNADKRMQLITIRRFGMFADDDTDITIDHIIEWMKMSDIRPDNTEVLTSRDIIELVGCSEEYIEDSDFYYRFAEHLETPLLYKTTNGGDFDENYLAAKKYLDYIDYDVKGELLIDMLTGLAFDIGDNNDDGKLAREIWENLLPKITDENIYPLMKQLASSHETCSDDTCKLDSVKKFVIGNISKLHNADLEVVLEYALNVDRGYESNTSKLFKHALFVNIDTLMSPDDIVNLVGHILKNVDSHTIYEMLFKKEI